jgi:hypothetical protein
MIALLTTSISRSGKPLRAPMPHPTFYDGLCNRRYLPAGDYRRLGTIFGVIFLGALLLLGVPWAGILWAR